MEFETGIPGIRRGRFWALLLLTLFTSVLAKAGERVDTIHQPTVEVLFLDIGQGDATLIQTKDGKNILVDTGPPSARTTLQKLLAERGVTQLDGFIVTHAHADHMGNALAILDLLPVRAVFDSGFPHATRTYAQFLEKVEMLKKQGEMRYIQPREGFSFPVGKHLKVEVLAPGDPMLQGTRSDPNANSVILRLVAGDTSLLMTGDAEHDTEVRLLQRQVNRLHSDVLKVAHHGSRYASGLEFLDRVEPRDAVISCGRDNKYGHPAPETLERLRSKGVQTWITAEKGDIALRTNGSQYSIGPVSFTQIASATDEVQSLKATGVQIAQTSQINLNTATETQLVTLKGIGPGKAKAILAYRSANGPFTSIDGLTAVKGIGAKTVEKLRPFLTVGGGGTPGPTAEHTGAGNPLPSPTSVPVETGDSSDPHAIILNTATFEQLKSLPGIGKKKAEAILEFRNSRQGGFSSLDELTSVKGIGAKTLTKLRPYLRLNPPANSEAPQAE